MRRIGHTWAANQLLGPCHSTGWRTSQARAGAPLVLSARRNLFHSTSTALFELNPAQQGYNMEHAFEEPTFRFICEGVDVDFKEDIREALRRVLPPSPTNFTQRAAFAEALYATQADVVDTSKKPVLHVLRLFRELLQRTNQISYAMIRSSPEKLASFYETVATVHPALALLAADHFTFAGMIATHAPVTVQQRILGDAIDSAKWVGCVAQRELIADEAPLNTEARYDAADECFVLRGSGKFSVVAAEVAEWAIVTATLTLNKKDHHGVQTFVVPLRENGSLLEGVHIAPVSGENTLLSATGAAVIHFDDVRLPKDHMLNPVWISEKGTLEYVAGKEGNPTSPQVLQRRCRLATGSIYVGLHKRLLRDTVRYVAHKEVVGPDGSRNYPLFGLQHVQTPLVSLVAKFFVYLITWHKLLPTFSDVSRPDLATIKDDMKLGGTVHFLADNLISLNQFMMSSMPIHGTLHSSGGMDAITAVHLRTDGLDASYLIREVAMKSVIGNIGTTHWGWKLANVLQPIMPAVDRFLKNPLYSPRLADLGRHLLFFSHKHYTTRRRLAQSRELERRKGGSEHQWYDVSVFRHREVVHCGEAFMESQFIEIMMNATQECSDPRGRKILRDICWIYCLARQMDRMDFLLSAKMLSPNKALILASHLDNLVTVLAPQCGNLVDAMQLSATAPCGLAEAMESYWTIPGTNPSIQRGDSLTMAAKKEDGNTKAEQEAMRESPEDVDLFHGLADDPSYKTVKK